jgi:hypothetical protein
MRRMKIDDQVLEQAISAALYEARRLLKHVVNVPDHIAVQVASMAADINDSKRKQSVMKQPTR